MRHHLKLRSLWLPLVIAAIAVPSLSAQALTMVSGNGQLVFEQFPTAKPLTVQALDAFGRPAPNVTITWSIPQAAGTLNPQTSITDANGQAQTTFLGTSLQPGISYTTTTVTASSPLSASVNFVVTTIASQGTNGGGAQPAIQLVDPAQYSTITGPSGSTLRGALTVQVAAGGGASQGQGIPNIGVSIENADHSTPGPAACSGTGGVALTNSTGRATCDLVIQGSPGTYQILVEVGGFQGLQLNLQITPGNTCSFSISPTSKQFGSSGGPGSVSVTTASTCSWIATSNANWITITSGSAGSGNGTVSYSVAPNTSAARTGTMLIAGQTFTVSEAVGTAPPGPLAIATSSLPGGSTGSPYSATVSATGGTSPYTFVLTGTLPTGLFLNSSTGVISGTPSSAGLYGFSVKVTDSVGAAQSQPFSINISGQTSSSFKITNVSFPNGVVGQPYQQVLQTVGGCVTPFSQIPNFALYLGNLPSGLGLTQGSDGQYSVTGSPTASGTFTFTLKATAPCGDIAYAQLAITIGGAAPPPASLTVTPTSVVFTVQQGGSAPTPQSITVSASGQAIPYTAAVSSGGSFLTITSGASGTTTGTITIAANPSNLTTNTYSGGVTITPAGGGTALVVPVTLTVSAVPLTANPAGLSFTLQQGGVAPGPQTINVSGSGQTILYSANISAGGNFLTISGGANGVTPNTVTVAVPASATSLAPGVYNGSVTIAPSGGGSALNVLVTLTVTQAPPGGNLLVSPTSVVLTVPTGSQTNSQKAVLSLTSSAAAIHYTIAIPTGGSWLSVNSVAGDTPGAITVSVNATGLTAGTYSGLIIITPTAGSPANVPVTLNVVAPSPSILSLTNAATNAPGPIAPGEIVVIKGSSLGPVTPMLLQVDPNSGLVSTNLSSTVVWFDDIPAPLVYTLGTQVAAIVPYEVAGRTSVRVQVEFQTVRSSAVNLNVVDSNPGIFTADSSGSGPGAILNQNFSVNSAQNGADAGTIVSIYATGEGQTLPLGVTGKITGAVLAKPFLPVSVQIDGQMAEVFYAGNAPDFPAGVFQVNAKIPASVRRGVAVPVTVTVGGASSPPGVTLFVNP